MQTQKLFPSWNILHAAMFFLLTTTAFGKETKSMSLEEQLRAKAQESAQKMSPEKAKTMSDAIDALKAEKILATVPKVGDMFPEFNLLDVKGRVVGRKEVLTARRTIVTFYRGGWCPYCSLQLRAFQDELPKILSKKSRLLAISPELPDQSLSTQEKNQLEFTVLSDKGQELARKLGLVYKLPVALQELYRSFKIDLPQFNGDGTWELPLAATFVLDESGKIIYVFANEDYKIRAPMTDILKALD